MRLAPVCFIVGLCVPGVLRADTRVRRDPEPPAAAPFSDRVRPPPTTTTAQPPALPALSNDVVLSMLPAPGHIREEQERILADLIANTPDSAASEKAEYYFRLGELYARQILVWQRKAKDLPASDPNARSAAQRAKVFVLKTVKAFKALTDNPAFRDYPKLDLAGQVGDRGRRGRRRRCGEPQESVSRRARGVLRHGLLGAFLAGEGVRPGPCDGPGGQARRSPARHLVHARGHAQVGPSR